MFLGQAMYSFRNQPVLRPGQFDSLAISCGSIAFNAFAMRQIEQGEGESGRQLIGPIPRCLCGRYGLGIFHLRRDPS